jgi:outer membrane biosynthesis protein TonB
MKKSVLLSTVFHGAILALALFSIPASNALKAPPVNAIEVDISQISDDSKRLAATTDDVPETTKPAPKKMEMVKETPPAPKVSEEINTAAKEPVAPEPPKPPEPKKEEPKKEEPKKEEPKKVEEKPLDSDPLKQLIAQQEAEKKKEEKKKVEEQKKAEEKKKTEDKKKADEKKKLADKKKRELMLEDITEFLDKKDGERTTQVASAVDGSPKKAEKAMAGADASVSATLIEALVSRVKQCFTVPPAARDADITVPISFTLAEDGSVTSVQPEQSYSDPIYAATAAAGVAAVKGCEPYELPPDKYDLWKAVVLDFNPNMMSR